MVLQVASSKWQVASSKWTLPLAQLVQFVQLPKVGNEFCTSDVSVAKVALTPRARIVKGLLDATIYTDTQTHTHTLSGKFTADVVCCICIVAKKPGILDWAAFALLAAFTSGRRGINVTAIVGIYRNCIVSVMPVASLQLPATLTHISLLIFLSLSLSLSLSVTDNSVLICHEAGKNMRIYKHKVTNWVVVTEHIKNR